MTLQIVICEDEPAFVVKLHEMIEKWSRQTNTEIICDIFRGDECLPQELMTSCDLWFFDIELVGISGIESAKQVRAYNEIVPIVFTTSHGNYVFEGYDVQAFKFLLKPVRETDCFACMERAKRYHITKETETITLTQNGGLHRIPICDILYIEAQRHYCNVVTLQKSHRFFLNFSSLLEKLPKGTLVQCHRSYIANFAHIVSMKDGYLTLSTLCKIPYSRTFAKQLLQKISEMG